MLCRYLALAIFIQMLVVKVYDELDYGDASKYIRISKYLVTSVMTFECLKELQLLKGILIIILLVN